jgi:hypothetical protein
LPGSIQPALPLRPTISRKEIFTTTLEVSASIFATKDEGGKQLKLNPRMADAHGSRGVTWRMQGSLAKAEADFARCRALGGTLKPEAERLWRALSCAPK